MRRLLIALLLPLLVSACAESVWAPDEDVARARYVSQDPPSITLFTVIRKLGNEGAHSGIMINASQRVIFDPAGTWHHPTVPERNDVHFGITPRMKDFYIDYHARETFDVYEQTVIVSPQIAAQALALVEGNGPVPKAMCGSNVSNVLSKLPGFESVGRTFFPKQIMKAFGELPGAVTVLHKDSDADDHSGKLIQQTATTP